MLKRRLYLIAGALLLIGAIAISSVHLLPLQNFLLIQQKPEQTPQKVYDYYIIIDEESGNHLMYVPLVVGIGDEVLSEDNKLYRVVRVEENQAYARYVKDVKLNQ